MIHIGKILEAEVREQRWSVTKLAKLINTERRNVYNIFERESIDTGLLLRLSELLRHDFFKYYSNLTEIKEFGSVASEPQEKYILKQEQNIKDLSEKVKVLELEIHYLKELMKEKDFILDKFKGGEHSKHN